MAGPSSLRSQKALLSRYCNSLDKIIEKGKAVAQEEPISPSQIQPLVFELTATSRLVSEALLNFTAAVDSLTDSLSEEQEEQADAYADRAHLALEQAQTLAIELEARRISAGDQTRIIADNTTVQTARINLPAIPIPTFTGKVWEFENFWALFAANVHDQPLTPLQKFNYLISALRGEARESVRRFTVTSDNYEHAVAFLRNKYGDESRLISNLQSRLENARAQKPTLAGQRQLLENIIPIVTQLEEKGISLNGSFLAQKILAKFSSAIQRKVLEHRMKEATTENMWIIRDILADVDYIITTEEQINSMMQNTKQGGRDQLPTPSTPKSPPPQRGSTPCLFCSASDHRSLACHQLLTIEQRKEFFREHNRCLNCAIPGHFTKECTREGCRLCAGKKHHHTLCPMRIKAGKTVVQKMTAPTKQCEAPRPQRITSQRKPPKEGDKSRKRRSEDTHAHTVATESFETPVQGTGESDQDSVSGTVLSTVRGDNVCVNRGDDVPAKAQNVLLLTGMARVKDLHGNSWKDVEILLDTGADQSFISTALADELGLRRSSHKLLNIYTFGSDKPKSTSCGLTRLEIWDAQDFRHELLLYTAPVVTLGGKTARLSKEDQTFIAQHQITLSRKNWEKISKPQILVGCDQLWTILDVPHPRYQLPSGLQLIPSKLGYLLTGRQQTAPYNTRERATSPGPCTVTTITNFDEDLERWDKYWTMDSAGVCEFTGTKKAEKEAINKQVAKFFEDTIEKRDDGYYVRLPYKEDHPPLPTNQAIALKRLQSVMNSLRKTPELLHDYDNTFKDQQDKGVIEAVPDPSQIDGPIVHYIPHQPVVTPHKETTKLRIVFDASAHFRESPSLNDVLHQGPLLLPELYAVLLRFRIPKYVITADVEKAFLQVRLQEQDRDATRFLWLLDPEKPANDENIKVFRFTRVTFGLNVSPYLLGGTIQHHLKTAVKDATLAEEIQNNLYVDNLVLSAESEQEITAKSLKAREIFSDMGMNLREFVSNNKNLPNILPRETYSKFTVQKILGITWNSSEDTLKISCKMTLSDTVTKRQVARQIASVFDPLGWLVPLMTPAKKFQQDLWRNHIQWDTNLPPDLHKEWEVITQNMAGFTKSLPRRICACTEALNLAVFADASEVAIAACGYLFNTNNSALVMARGKLPSIKTKTTMPKLEMNALTLAARLANSITQALKSRITEYPWTIYLFSDSQIVLSWLSSPQRAGLGVLVENRLREIRSLVAHLESEGVRVCFGYVNTSENPADAGTRGLSQYNMEHHIWWTGPPFLTSPVENWDKVFYPLATSKTASEELTCEDSTAVNALSTDKAEIQDLLNKDRVKSFTSEKRAIALALRFIKKIMRPLGSTIKKRIYEHIPELSHVEEKTTGLEGIEIRAARLAIIRNHQAAYVTKAYRKSMENTLRLFQDENQLWRSRGRFGNSTLKNDAKNPLFVAPNTTLAKLIIEEAHGNYHQGIEHTMTTVRQQYWIPKLRQQVRKLISHCMKCRRFNALPYHYPDMTDLPSQRVLQCRPFQHTGLDFFDLPPCKEDDHMTKLYGCIFTCTVTRLIHLEVVRSMATEEFLNALRRFVARRGLPETIICDNAPTFLLSANIVGNPDHAPHEDVLRCITNKEIQWKHITPYAPWQGGFYERLIKSIKHALYKALRGTNRRSFDNMQTLVAEVEACLNSRPLTYQGSTQEALTSIRPIDFVHHDMTLTLPMPEDTGTEGNDPDYLNAERQLQYRQQVLEALHSSYQEVERFWNIWQQQYLLSLREHHKKQVSNRRQGTENPNIGDVVLVSDPVLPRNEWKMGRITELRRGRDGEVREAELVSSTRRKIRRPINLLIPLEIQETRTAENDEPQTGETREHDDQPEPTARAHPYNLRRRQPVNYTENSLTTTTGRPGKVSPKWFLFHLMIASIIQIATTNPTSFMTLKCNDKGIFVNASAPNDFEICADSTCKIERFVNSTVLVKFPPEVTVTDYKVLLKWQTNGHITVMETKCQGLDYCENLDCSICTSLVLNPECWPLGAILTIALAIYAIVAFFYTLLYVPMTIGKPIRLILSGLGLLCSYFLKCAGCCFWQLWRTLRRKARRSARARLAAALAVILSTSSLHTETLACQQINVLEHQSTTCTQTNGTELCTVTVSDVLKLNTFKQQACLRLTRNSTLVANVKIRWEGLYLRCEQETSYFTRAVDLRIVDSKRCPNMGSCSGDKCAAINSSSLIPELAEGNDYPGRTGCIESCGGFGCDCFYLSSGCLFYRIYAMPKNTKIYEVFKCMRWTEHVQLEITVENVNTKTGPQRYNVRVVPNIPTEIAHLRLTMTMLTLPPIPKLNSEFITDGSDTAIWSGTVTPSLRCNSRIKAESLNCTFLHSCDCSPAESRVLCECAEADVLKEFDLIQQQLPVKTAYWELMRGDDFSIVAKIPHLVSSEIIMNFHHVYDTAVVQVTNHSCIVMSTSLKGCYHCAKGAVATVRCTAEKHALGEILCDQHAFVIPCAPGGLESTLRFHMESAHQLLECSISCGEVKNFFKLSGVLNYINSVHYYPFSRLEGNTTVYNEFDWPDFHHIFNVMLNSYKLVLLVFGIVVMLLVLTYIWITTCGPCLLKNFVKLLWKINCLPVRTLMWILNCILKARNAQTNERGNATKKIA